LDWQEGSANGGTPVLDYKIIYGEDTGSFNQEIAGVLTTEYTVPGILTPGTTYKFKIQARNAFGFSLDS
jgi:hypothetical protein